MKRHKVDPNNLPEGEVLAIGYQQEMLIGYLGDTHSDDEVVCESEGELLTKVTHYILKSDLLNLPEE